MTSKVLLGAACLLLLGPGGAGATTATAEDLQPGEAVLSHLREGNITPEEAAAAAARRGDFRMFQVDYVRGGEYLPGVACATPYGQPPGILMTERRGDYVVIPDLPREQFDALTPRYNRALVSAPQFPYADLCAPAERSYPSPAYAKALRPPFGPPRDLWAAARYGSAADIRRYLKTTPIDQEDPFGMTALAWASARGRGDVVRRLLAAGADPLHRSSKFGEPLSPLHVAVFSGHPALIDPLLRARRTAEPWRWRPAHAQAALDSGDLLMLRRILSEPHDDPGRMMVQDDIPLAVAQVLVGSRHKAIGETILLTGAAKGRPDLVRLALDHGASPDAAENYETALALAAKGLRGEADVESVRRLLAAGADVNLRNPNDVWGETPVWEVAAGFDDYRRATWSSQEKILRQLLAAGADLERPSRKGVPLIWRLLFSPRVSQDEIGSAPPPHILALLASHGMDVNAEWQGHKPLDWVEAETGRDSEIARTLRAAGAVRGSPQR
ncbi:MAG: ankyrin repeat domain-containing protein [Caulobacter sp.]|nr:ankyrin repeat domain-containing protein [Caulobacter sp.]